VPDRAPRHWVVTLTTHAALALLCGIAVADDPKQPDPGADAELLEFLGSVDSGADSQTSTDDETWIDYLSQTDIGKVAKAADPKDASRNQTASDAPASAPPKTDRPEKNDE